MNVNIESPSALRRKVVIQVEPDEIQKELDKTYNELKRGVVLKGFRPGRAPRKLLERYFGDQVRTDVIQKLVKEYTDKALEENSLKPLLAPEIITEETDLNKELKFSAIFDVRPELEIKDYQGLKVQRPRIEVAGKDVDEALERMRQRQATLKKVEGRTRVQKDDFVLAEIEGHVDGKPDKDLKLPERLLEVSSERIAHGLDEVLTGAEVGKQAKKRKTYPADYAEKDLAGKTVEWHATAKEIYQKQVPNLDDEFAKDSGEESLAGLRERIHKSLEEQAKSEADSRARQALIDIVIDRNPIEVPESLVTREQRAMENEMHSAFEAAGIAHEQAAERVKQAAEDINKRANRRAQTALLLDAIADQEKIEVSDDEVAERIAKMVTNAGRQRDQIAEFYRREENREMLKQSSRREKTLDLLMTRAQVEEAAAEPAQKKP